MCKFKSGIILKNKVVLTPEGNESHSDLLESLGIEDTHMNATKTFVRAELSPKDDNKYTDISKWKYRVDQDIVPNWYEEDSARYEQEFKDAVRTYMKEYMEKRNIVTICGYGWTKIKEDENGTYYLMDGSLKESKFGRTNNYADSYIRKNLNESNLSKELKEKFGDNLVPITTNLLSLDGLDDYGKVDGDILAIPTIDLYRECRKNISNLDSWFWTCTPDSTPSGCGSGSVRCVRSGGYVDYGWCGYSGAVRPFFILKSDIFVSCEETEA
ncbi:MAG: hypothetical protein HDQ99_02835 [Lachnospiraceae bacterium]|nr:hypothetical protein [Lachnospiraceae bacterium]